MALIRINSTNDKIVKDLSMSLKDTLEEKGYKICEVNHKMTLTPIEEYEGAILFAPQDGFNEIL